MNILLFEQHQFICKNHVMLDQRQQKHVQMVHQALEGDELKVGIIDGAMGVGTITHSSKDQVLLEVNIQKPPPLALPLIILLSLPRPKMLKRSLQHLTALGVKNIILLNSFRVEKSFWYSPSLQPEKIREQLLLGLEQAGDTVMPLVTFEKRFKPFVEDRLPLLLENRMGFVAHPVGGKRCPHLPGETDCTGNWTRRGVYRV